MLLGTIFASCFDCHYLRRFLYFQGFKDMLLWWGRFCPLQHPAMGPNKFAQVHTLQGLAYASRAILHFRFR
ncbi:MAG: hypothetical protein ACPLQP_04360 [Moorellaceae bacterium]